MKQIDEIERRAQLEEGRRLAAADGLEPVTENVVARERLTLKNVAPLLMVPNLPDRSVTPSRPAQATKRDKKRTDRPSGHEGYLEGVRASGNRIWIKTLDGHVTAGTVRAYDKYTVSIVEDNGELSIIFKHALMSFGPSSERK